MSTRLVVRNLSGSMNNLRLEQLFSRHGRVDSIRIVLGEGHVQMSSTAETQQAMAALQGCLMDGLALSITEAPSTDEPEPATLRPRYGNGRSGRSGGGGVRSGRRS